MPLLVSPWAPMCAAARLGSFIPLEGGRTRLAASRGFSSVVAILSQRAGM